MMGQIREANMADQEYFVKAIIVNGQRLKITKNGKGLVACTYKAYFNGRTFEASSQKAAQRLAIESVDKEATK